MMTDNLAPIITLDGMSGSGKGTIAMMLAKALGWHMLDSGAIYRAIGWAVLQYQVALEDEPALAALLQRLQIAVEHPHSSQAKVFCDGNDITQAIRSEECGLMASRSSAIPVVRASVLQYQRDFRRPPGLIADGRDMGTVVFPDAELKLYLVADPAVRALRRCQQLQDRGISVSLRDIENDLAARDQRDASRSISPTKPATDAVIIDTSNLSVEEVFERAMSYVHQYGLVDKGSSREGK